MNSPRTNSEISIESSDYDSEELVDEYEKLVDVGSVPWIKELPEVANSLSGLLVPNDANGSSGYLMSLVIVVEAYLSEMPAPKNIEHAFFREIQRLLHEDVDLLRKAIHLISSARLYKLKIDFAEFSIIKNDYELLMWLTNFFESSMLLELDDIEKLSAHIRSHPERFFKLFDLQNIYDQRISRYLLNLGLDMSQLRIVFSDKEASIIAFFKRLCSEADTVYLSSQQVRQQLRQLYAILPSKYRPRIQLLLFYRSILSADEIDAFLTPSAHCEYLALLLSEHRDQSLSLLTSHQLAYFVYLNSRIDPSLIDWYIDRVDRRLQIKQECSENDSTIAKPFAQLQCLSKNEIHEFVAHLHYSARNILERKKVAAYVYSGQSDFLRFLHECPSDLLPFVTNTIASTSTAEELSIFLERADDKIVKSVYSFFWKRDFSDEGFDNCALQLLHRISRIQTKPKSFWLSDIKTEKLFSHPDVLHLLHSFQLKLRFSFRTAVKCVMKDCVFQNMMQFRDIISYSATLPFSKIFLPTFEEQIDRILTLLNVSAHQFLKIYWSRRKLSSKRLNWSYLVTVYPYLKHWKRDNPGAVNSLLAADARPIEHFVRDPETLALFDEDAKQLIRAHLLLGRAIENYLQISGI